MKILCQLPKISKLWALNGLASPKIWLKIFNHASRQIFIKEDFTEEQLSKSTKQAIRTARNKGISVQFGGTELLDQFADLMKKTEARKNIHLRGIDYYEKLLTTYPESSYITLSTLDLPARLKDLNKQLEKNIADAAKFTEKPNLEKLRTINKSTRDFQKKSPSFKKRLMLVTRLFHSQVP